MFNQLFPQRADNTYRGHKLGLCFRPRSDLPVLLPEYGQRRSGTSCLARSTRRRRTRLTDSESLKV
jgi:hypothetical protein